MENTKKEVKTNRYQMVAENVEKAFKADKRVDVIADTRLENPASIYPEFSYIHFFKPGTEKNMFGCYMQGKNKTRFAVSNKLVAYLDQSLKAFPNIKKVKDKTGNLVEKTTFYIVECADEEVVGVGQKILEAYTQMIAATPVKPEKKAKEKKAEEPKAEKKPETKAETKKATVAKRPAKKAVNE